MTKMTTAKENWTNEIWAMLAALAFVLIVFLTYQNGTSTPSRPAPARTSTASRPPALSDATLDSLACTSLRRKPISKLTIQDLAVIDACRTLGN